MRGTGFVSGNWESVPGVAFHNEFRGCIHGGTEDAASVEVPGRGRDRVDASRESLIRWPDGLQWYRLLMGLRHG
jgi:hypothetical protein